MSTELQYGDIYVFRRKHEATSAVLGYFSTLNLKETPVPLFHRHYNVLAILQTARQCAKSKDIWATNRLTAVGVEKMHSPSPE